MQRKRVLVVVHQLNHGGVQKALLSALDAVDYSKIDVTLYIRKNRIDFLAQVNSAVSEIIINDDKNSYYRKPYSIFLQFICFIAKLFGLKNFAKKSENKLNEYIIEKQMQYENKKFFENREPFDIAVSYIQGLPAKFVAEYIRADKKIVFFHGSTDERHELHEEIFSKFDNIVGVNEGVKEVLCGLYPRHADKITFLENYVDEKDVIEKCKEFPVKKEPEKTIICSCGRIAPVKGYDIAVKAAKILSEQGLLFKWYFVGDGPKRKEIECLIDEYKLSGFVEITGMKDNPYPWIDACDIFVQPSYEEAHPLSIIEAQILQKPVVSTATVGGKCLVKDNVNGYVTEINAQAVAQGIVRLIQNENLYENMIWNLKEKNYSEAQNEYREKWKRLLDD